MITEISNGPKIFQKNLEKIYIHHRTDDSSFRNKEKAWQRLQEIGLPTRKSEVFQYVPLRTLYATTLEPSFSPDISVEDFKSHILPECQQSVLIFVNGQYKPEFSKLSALPKRLVILPLQEASKTYGNFLNNQWNKLVKEELDPFVLLNAALHRDGLFIYAPPKTVLDVPLQILHVTKHSQTPVLFTPRIQGLIGTQSQIDILSTHIHLEGGMNCSTCLLDLSIEEEAHVRYFQVPFQLSSQAWVFDALRANLKRNSTLKTVLASVGSPSMRHDYRISLQGENAEARLNGICMLSEQNEAHAHILMDHQAPFCRSMQFFKSVLNDVSRSSFEGKIYVHQKAQKTEAFQLNNNLLLSDRAIAYTKPNLEIFADDVKASHGATVGQLDSEQLFYLRTRGYTEAAAKNILVYGFCKEIFDLIPYPSVIKNIEAYAARYLVYKAKEQANAAV